MNINLINRTTIRVRYGETDQMGYVYYGNYAQYFEVGRVEAMRALGMSYRELEETGYMLPVMSFNVNYIVPAKYDDVLTIETEIVSLNGIRLRFYYKVYKDEKLLCEGETILVFVDKTTMKPIQPPKHFVALVSGH